MDNPSRQSSSHDSPGGSLSLLHQRHNRESVNERRVVSKHGTTYIKRVTDKICTVCGAPSSGYNFDIICCESCKAFVRRNAERFDQLKCNRGNKCDVTAKTRRTCGACRMNKCLALGMNIKPLLEAIKHERTRSVGGKEERKTSNASLISSCSSTTDDIDGSLPSTSSAHRCTDAHLSFSTVKYCSQPSLSSSDKHEDVKAPKRQCLKEDIEPMLRARAEAAGTETPVIVTAGAREIMQSTLTATQANIAHARAITPPAMMQMSASSTQQLNYERAAQLGQIPPINLAMVQYMQQQVSQMQSQQQNGSLRLPLAQAAALEHQRLQMMATPSVPPMRSSTSDFIWRIPDWFHERQRRIASELFTASLPALSQFDHGAHTDQVPLLTAENGARITQNAIRQHIEIFKNMQLFRELDDEDQYQLIQTAIFDYGTLRNMLNYDRDRDAFVANANSDCYQYTVEDILRLVPNTADTVVEFIRNFEPSFINDRPLILIMMALSLFNPRRSTAQLIDRRRCEENYREYARLLHDYLLATRPHAEVGRAYQCAINCVEHELMQDHCKRMRKDLPKLNQTISDPLLDELANGNADEPQPGTSTDGA